MECVQQEDGAATLSAGDAPVESISAEAGAYTTEIMAQQPDIQRLLARRFQQIDEDDQQFLCRGQLALLLSQLDLHLNTAQVQCILSSLNLTQEEDTVEWSEFNSKVPALVECTPTGTGF